MSTSTISVITPSFNQGQFIEETIDSVLSQNYQNLDYIIIDGGSTDQTVEIIKKYEKHLSYWVSEKDRGQSHAINKGFEKAKGEIVAWLNSDDLYLNDTFKIVSEELQDPSIDIVYGDVLNFSSNSTKEYIVPQFSLADFLKRVSIHQPAVFWRRQLLKNEGLLKEKFYYTMDYDLWMRLFLNYNHKKIDHFLAKFRIHEDSKTGSNPPEMYTEYRKVLFGFFQNRIDEKRISGLKEMFEFEEFEQYRDSLNIPDEKINEYFDVFLLECAKQEYGFENYDSARAFLSKIEDQRLTKKKIEYTLKSNLKISKWKKFMIGNG